jgi:hypothetical protein
MDKMIYGFLKAQSVLLSEISSGLKENIMIKKLLRDYPKILIFFKINLSKKINRGIHNKNKASY